MAREQNRDSTWRAPGHREVQVLAQVLALTTGAARVDLARQIEVKSSCRCGCASIAIRQRDRPAPPAGSRTSSFHFDVGADDEHPNGGGMILWLVGEDPVELEIFDFDERPFSAFPPLDQIRPEPV